MAQLNPALRSFWRTKADIKVLKGGRSSTKTWDTAGIAVHLASKYTLKFLCMRQFQNRIKDSVYAVLVVRIEEFGLRDQFDIQNSTIRHRHTGSEFHFYGIKRHTSEIKGFEGADIGWIEEGEGLTAEQWKDIEPTLRKEGAEGWILYNPNFVSDFVETFKHDPENGIMVRHINYDENPFLSNTMRRKIERMKESDYDEYVHVYLGVPRSDDDRVIIKRSWIMASIDAHKKLGISPEGRRRIGYDVADGGKDKNATVSAIGFLAMSVQQWQGQSDELMTSCKRVHLQARQMQGDIWYDNIGVGAFCGSKFKEINSDLRTRIAYAGFGAGEKKHNPDDEYQHGISNKDFFSNLKAQSWWTLADRFRNTYNAIHHDQKFTQDQLISINGNTENLDQLIEELSTPRKDFDVAGRVKVESKKDLDKRDVKSPNLAEAFVIAFNPMIGSLVNYGDLL